MQGGLRDFQAANHAAGVFANQAVGDAREAHERQGFEDARSALSTRRS
jgi:hypothetical protein